MAPKVVTLTDFHTEVSMNILRHPDWRIGQSMFNTLYEMRPDLSEQIRAQDLDPFHIQNDVWIDNERVDNLLVWLNEHWGDVVPEGFKKPTAKEILQRTMDEALR